MHSVYSEYQHDIEIECLGALRVEVFMAWLTFKCMTEHLFADFSYSIALDTYL